MTNQDLIVLPVQDEFSKFRTYYTSLFTNKVSSVDVLLKFLAERKGKMMRPLLVLLTAKCFDAVPESVYHLAASIELLHQGSLIHDDVIDESDKRRGKDSANAIYDNKLAVLLGDYVVSMGLKEITATGDVRSVDTISSLIGTLSEGEIIQLDALNLPNLSEDLYFDIITKKTAYLFAASSEMSAYLSGATLEEVEKMRRLGEIIGLCFQIKDDIFDYHKSTEIGKPFGNDLREGKFTLPAIYALTHSDRDWSIYVQDVRSLSATQDQIEEITNYTIANGGIEYAEAKMQELKKQAISLLPAHISNDLREAFIAYLDIIINRKK